MRTALVTGAKGFVGRHMAAALDNLGYHVTCLDLLDEPIPHDIRDYFRKFDTRFDLVVHCAAVVGGRTMIDGEPLRLAAEDLSIDAELFRWALRTRPGRIVYFSSSAAYPVSYQTEVGRRRLNETMIPLEGGWYGKPDATYGWVKLSGERLAEEANAEGIPTFVFRPFSGYGADQALDYPFPAIIRRAMVHPGAATDFEVWGHAGSTRDWVHIDDVVACVLAHLDADVRGPVNICTGVATTFERLAWLALAEVHGARHNVAVIGSMDKPMGVMHRVGDPAKMGRVYQPKISVEEGVFRAVRMYKDVLAR